MDSDKPSINSQYRTGRLSDPKIGYKMRNKGQSVFSGSSSIKKDDEQLQTYQTIGTNNKINFDTTGHIAFGSKKTSKGSLKSKLPSPKILTPIAREEPINEKESEAGSEEMLDQVPSDSIFNQIFAVLDPEATGEISRDEIPNVARAFGFDDEEGLASIYEDL